MRFAIIIYWSKEDDVFIAEVPELTGCMADGNSYVEAVENVQVVIEQWIETAKELNRPIPEPKGRLVKT
jgi:predicted RNase H-like HicB family nuclease